MVFRVRGLSPSRHSVRESDSTTPACRPACVRADRATPEVGAPTPRRCSHCFLNQLAAATRRRCVLLIGARQASVRPVATHPRRRLVACRRRLSGFSLDRRRRRLRSVSERASDQPIGTCHRVRACIALTSTEPRRVDVVQSLCRPATTTETILWRSNDSRRVRYSPSWVIVSNEWDSSPPHSPPAPFKTLAAYFNHTLLLLLLSKSSRSIAIGQTCPEKKLQLSCASSAPLYTAGPKPGAYTGDQSAVQNWACFS